jgi:hypothetical protein
VEFDIAEFVLKFVDALLFWSESEIVLAVSTRVFRRVSALVSSKR